MIRKKIYKIILAVVMMLLVVTTFCVFVKTRKEDSGVSEEFEAFATSYINLKELEQCADTGVVVPNEEIRSIGSDYVDAVGLARALGGSVTIDGTSAKMIIGSREYLFESDSYIVSSQSTIKAMDRVASIDGSSLAISLNSVEDVLGYRFTQSDDSITFKHKFETKRLIVRSSKASLNYCNEVAVAEGYDDLHILQYASIEDAELAYEFYSCQEYVDRVIVDSYVYATSTTEGSEVDGSYNETTGEFSYTSWGAGAMGVNEYSKYLKTLQGNLPEVVVAVLDTGIDSDHAWFEGRIAEGGKNFSGQKVTSTAEYEDGHGHGTHVSGIITDLTLDNVKILPIKVMKDNGTGDHSCIVLGLEYIKEISKTLNIKVINMSIGGPYGEGSSAQQEYIDIIDELYDLGILTVVAAGNDSQDASNESPANVENAITVSSISQAYSGNDKYIFSYFSNYGSYIDYCAPGGYVTSARVGGGTKADSGTSMAAPHVAGTIALLYTDKDKNYHISQIEPMLDLNATDLGTSGWDFEFGVGLVNLSKANVLLLEEVAFNATDGTDGSIELTLSHSNTDAKIYYTLDGSIPSLQSTLYTEPILIKETTQVSAIALVVDNDEIKAFSKCKTLNYIIDGKDAEDAFVINATGVIESYKGLLKDIVIPEKINDINVTGIGEYAFQGTTVESVSLPNTLTKIGVRAFATCTTLKSIYAPSVTVVDQYAFDGCESLLEVNDQSFPELVEIGRFAFRNCVAINEINLSKVELIEYAAFYTGSIGMPGVKTLDLSGVKIVADFAFQNLNELTTINMPNVQFIGSNALRACDIRSISLDNLLYLGDYALYANNNLTSVNLPKAVAIGGMSLYTELDYGTGYIASQIESVLLPSLRNMGDMALAYSDSLTSLDLPELTYLGYGALFGCENLASIYVPRLQVMERESLAACTSLTTLNLPSLVDMGEWALDWCESLNYVELSSCVEVMPSDPFDGINVLCEFGVHADTVAEQYVKDCGYKYVIISSDEFDWAYAEVDGGIEITGYVGEVVSDLTIPTTIEGKDVISIAESAFEGCQAIVAIRLNNVTSIGSNAFKNCVNLESVYLPNVVSIGASAFENCVSLQSIDIMSAQRLADRALYNCTNLKSVKLGEDILSIGEDSLGKTPEGNVDEFKLVGYAGSIAQDYAEDNSLEFVMMYRNLPAYYFGIYTTDIGIKELYISHVESYITGNIILPSSYDGQVISAIGVSAFKGCCFLTGVTLPASIVLIDNNAFSGCSMLKSINLENVTEIGSAAFSDCVQLQSINAEKLEIVADDVCYGCTALDYVNIPMVTSIGDAAFYNCYNLTSVVGDNITNIGQSAFYNCKRLKEISLSKVEILGTETVDTIYGEVFWGCSDLETVYLPKLHTIGNNVFTDVEAIYIGRKLISYAGTPYQNCTIYAVSGSLAQDSAIVSDCEFVLIDPLGIKTNLSSSYSVVSGNQFKLTVHVLGLQPKYQWYQRDTQGASVALENQTSNSLEIDTSSIGTYKYYVQVSDWDGEVVTSRVAMVSIVPPPPQIFSITATSIGPGTISPNGATDVTEGNSRTYNFVAARGAKLKDIYVDATPLSAEAIEDCLVNGYTFEDIDSDHVITAIYEYLKYNININIEGEGEWECSEDMFNVEYGDSRKIKVDTQEGYHIKEVYVNNELVDVVDNEINIKNISQDINIKVVFEEDEKEPINFTLDQIKHIAFAISAIMCLSVIVIVPAFIIKRSFKKHDRF